MSLASTYAAAVTEQNQALAAVQQTKPAPFTGPLVTITVMDDGSAQIAFGTNLYYAPAAAAAALGAYLVATFGP